MPESSTSGSEGRRTVAHTIEATTNAMSAVHWSMGVVRQARDRAERRVEDLVKEVVAARQKAAETSVREQKLKKTIEDLRAENAKAASELMSAKKESGQLHLQADDLSARCNTLNAKLSQLKSDAGRDRQTVQDTLSQKYEQVRSEFQTATEELDELRAQLAMERRLREDLGFHLDMSRRTRAELKQLTAELLESGQRTISEIEEALSSTSRGT